MTLPYIAGVSEIHHFVEKHHPVLFIVILLLLLSGAVFSLYQVIDLISTTPDQSTSSVANFDQKTVDKIKKLHDSTDTTTKLTFPTPRANPFVE